MIGDSIAGSVIGHQARKFQVCDPWVHNTQQKVQDGTSRVGQLQYQNILYQRDIACCGDVLEYQQNEFRRQLDHAGQ